MSTSAANSADIRGVTPVEYTDAHEATTYRWLARAVDALCPPPTPGMRLLDVGCGNGFWAAHFARRGYAVVGIDPSASGIEVARQAYPGIRFEQRVVSPRVCDELGEPPFDVIVSLDVVEHLYAPRDWALGCFHALRPGGTLVCSTPYHGYWKNLLLSLGNRWDAHWAPTWEGGHIKFWSRATLTRLLVHAGFAGERVAFRGVGRVPGLWRGMVLRAERPLSTEGTQP
jgi:2-polyprenyl-6-hydroxyphenyl methylase/3-demethylubiquinone-9 3-methyltransferase